MNVELILHTIRQKDAKRELIYNIDLGLIVKQFVFRDFLRPQIGRIHIELLDALITQYQINHSTIFQAKVFIINTTSLKR